MKKTFVLTAGEELKVGDHTIVAMKFGMRRQGDSEPVQTVTVELSGPDDDNDQT